MDACRELPKANRGTDNSQTWPSVRKGGESPNKRKIAGANPFAKKAKAAVS